MGRTTRSSGVVSMEMRTTLPPSLLYRLPSTVQGTDSSLRSFNLATRVAIPEAMEQQTISIAKAAITIILILGTSFLAAANPIARCYDALKVTGKVVEKILDWERSAQKQVKIMLKPAHVIL
ncbi:hypothetical protein ZEAMMB73_Zm00001d010285 [Zea mays]|uniref:MCM C-terminal AAA(+) ATPase domain-containing protein n=1 Tax=Zea mays TaxID=4577 RepID=A0A1D6FQ79_MAIZE|nr:hypothetical protein ZEAMMB73_Zm00001d010285 [Zea mays]